MKLNNEYSDFEAWTRRGSPRALLGLNVSDHLPGSPAGSDGVRIVSVSPGGPADIAGLRANDVIVTIGGKQLHGERGHSSHQILAALMSDIKADEPVMVEYRRDGNLQTTRVVPKKMPPVMTKSMDRALAGLDDRLDALSPILARRDSSGFGSAELLDLSPALGKYFGTEKGLLVVRAPRDERLKLQDGDVILDIDGRVPTGAAHALQILNSYRAGEKLKLHIMRQQKHVELPIEIPAEDSARQDPTRHTY
jgi:S1-C subfamily serine protease